MSNQVATQQLALWESVAVREITLEELTEGLLAWCDSTADEHPAFVRWIRYRPRGRPALRVVHHQEGTP